jgi:hypothetical protein
MAEHYRPERLFTHFIKVPFFVNLELHNYEFF